jgi:uncharacterized protein (DUF433 family)
MTVPTATTSSPETEEYRYLERRPHRWRKQLYLKGRNIPVGHLIYDMRANQMSPEAAAENYDLPLAQVREALAYYARHRNLIEQDQVAERRYLESMGLAIDPPPVPR